MNKRKTYEQKLIDLNNQLLTKKKLLEDRLNNKLIKNNNNNALKETLSKKHFNKLIALEHRFDIKKRRIKHDIPFTKEQVGERKTNLSFYKTNGLSYGLMLLVTALNIYYLVSVLKILSIDYRIMVVILFNILVILILFMCSMKIKVYSKFWSIFGLCFSGYILVRMFLLVPSYLKIDTGKNKGILVTNLLIFGFALLSSLYSYYRVSKQKYYKRDGLINYKQLSK